MNYSEIGARIRALRKQQGYTQEAFAEAVDLSSSYLSHIETGYKKASLVALVQIANVLGVNLDQLLYGNQVPDPTSAATPDPLSCSDLPEVQELLEMASEQERQFLYETVRAIQQSLRDNNLIT